MATTWGSSDLAMAGLGIVRCWASGDGAIYRYRVLSAARPGSELRRITFFVEGVEPTPDGWIVRGVCGVGPPQQGDAFSFVHHLADDPDDDAVLRVVETAPDWLRLVSQQPLRLRAGDFLGGDPER
jgi:hypothetical protein